MTKPLTTGSEWTFDLLDAYYKEIERIGKDYLKLDIYPNQIEIISAEQMLDAYCITPDHKLLKSDLRWVEAGSICVGDVVLGFDEGGPSRNYRASTVQRVSRAIEPVYEVVLSSGKEFKVTADHLWLVRQQKGKTSQLLWRKTTQLRSQSDEGSSASRIPKVIDTWDEIDSKDAGWLAGMYDGEGNIIRGSVQQLAISQNDGATLDKIKQMISHHGYTYYQCKKPTTSKCYTVGITGSSTDRLKFLGSIRPERLIAKVSFDKIGMMKTPEYEEVVSVTPIGDMEIVKITTSTGTFICDGYPMHNCSVGMPINYTHWSFGKAFVRDSKGYTHGQMGLAYEIVLNTSPCLVYCMEENTMMMQILVMAHAGMGHNAFFKNNYMFKQWTDAESIIDYLVFAKNYISSCEEKYGISEVESVLDACHALQSYGVDKYKRPSKISMVKEEQRQKERNEYLQAQVNDLWRTIPAVDPDIIMNKERFPAEPEENILYFIEKHAPNLPTWKREIIRIVRKISQYFYPQKQTKVMNEGFATFVHYTIMHKLRDENLIDDGFMLEFMASHTGVVRQLPFDHKYYSGINPYALGFAMFMDIKRICENPTEEDKVWFPDMAGSDWNETILFAMKNFKDESFIRQYLSPKVMRDLKLFSLQDFESDSMYEVGAIHDDTGYKRVRSALAEQYDLITFEPNIQVSEVNVWGDRTLTLHHFMHNQRYLEGDSTKEVLKHVSELWGFDVLLETINSEGSVKARFRVSK